MFNKLSPLGGGSPPHVWRIPQSEHGANVFWRITSTCVENTSVLPIMLLAFKDHLHMCGEYLYNTGELAPGQGSPPHVWRIHDEHFKIWQTGRITSTCVENTYDVGLDRDASEDHLHMCGEYTWQLTILNPK